MVRRVAVTLLIAVTFVLAGVGGYSIYSRYGASPDMGKAEVPVFNDHQNDPAPQPDQFAKLAETDPVGMLAACLARYERDARGFQAILVKRERVGGVLGQTERIRVAVDGDVPESGKTTHVRVRMIWDEGARKDSFGNEVRGSAYVEGANRGQMLIFRPKALILQDFSIDPKVKMARDTSRYCITDAGLYRSMLRTYTAWKKRQEAGELTAKYLGKRTAPEVGGRECYEVRRTCTKPEVDPFALDEQPPTDQKVIDRDGFTEVTLLIDCERRLQLGTIIRRADGELVGEYYFRDVVLTTTEFPPDTFAAPALRN